MFRLARAGDPDALYFKGGFLGLHLFSKAFMYEGKKFGSAFQFGHFLGVGVDFGDRHQYSMSYRFQHMSNAGIVEPNQGVNLSELHVGYFFMMGALSLSSIPAVCCGCMPASAGG